MGVDNDAVRRRTAANVLRRIDDGTISSLARHADGAPNGIGLRLAALEREWDIDRIIELEAATMGLVGTALAFRHRGWAVLPAVVAASLLAFASTRRYPLLPLLRRLGVRSAREIAREQYALKALRGDFADLTAAPQEAATRADSDDPARRRGEAARAWEVS